MIIASIHFGLLVLLLGNAFWWQSSLLGIILGALYLIYYGTLVGKYLKTNNGLNTIAGTLLWTVWLSAISGLVYKIWNLNKIAIFTIILLSPTILVIYTLIKKPSLIKTQFEPIIPQEKRYFVKVLILAIFIGLFISAIKLLINASTTEAIRSVWHIVDPSFFVILFVLNITAIALVILPAKKIWQDYLILASVTALTLSIGLIVYKIGYGFDPFVHRATESLIIQSGFVSPKPWYYLGQYGLVVILQAIFYQSVDIVDKLLLPIATALTLPLILLTTLQRFGANQRSTVLTALLLLALPLNFFIATTPQGLANLILIALIFLVFNRDANNYQPSFIEWSLSFSALIMHPIAGVPALMMLSLITVKTKSKKYPLLLSSFLSIVYGLILPSLFLIQEISRRTASAFASLPTIPPEATARHFFYFEQRYNFIFDTLYEYSFNLPSILIFLSLIGLYLLWKQTKLSQNYSQIIIATILIIDALILKYWFSFNFLIDYERDDFANRLFTVAFIFLLPYAATAILELFKNINKAPITVILFFLLIIPTAKIAGVYLTYPRFDDYQFDRGYSTSAHDLLAVRSVDENSNQPYLVLANQAVSAAALQELGFKKYYMNPVTKEDIFFYPIPTGGTLYQYYLKMVYETPSKETALEAMKLVGANELYFILNDYWFDSEKIKEEAQKTANKWWEIDNGKIFVFKYINN